jgi:hypothetical protein
MNLTSKEERALKLSEYRMLRKMFAPEREDSAASRGKLHNELISRSLRWAGHVARMESLRSPYRVLAGKRQRKKPFQLPTRACVCV